MNSDIYKIISRYFAAEASEAECRLLEQWRNESLENQRVFEAAQKIWQTGVSGALEDVSQIEEDWQRLQKRIRLAGLTSAQPKIISGSFSHKPAAAESWRWRIITAAASIILFLTLGIWLYWFSNPDQEIITENAQQKQVTLPDGSLVYLNNASKLIFPASFSGGARNVKLSGEAFFEIVSGELPFIVETENSQIRVLGTKFNVWSRAQETRLIVKEGRVEFKARQFPENSVVLEEDRMSICRENNTPNAPQLVDAVYRLGWLKGVIVFDQTPLAEIAAELTRVYNVKIEIEDPSLSSQTLTGTFRNKPLKSVISAVCQSLALQYVEEKDKIVITKADNF